MIPWRRTTCACDECVQCCKRQPGPLIPGDLERIATYLSQTLEAVKAKFCASAGTVVGDSRTGRTYRIGTITPTSVDGRCVFLDSHDRCSIHPVAPFGCAYFDRHMSKREGDDRVIWMVQQTATPEYQSLRYSLEARRDDAQTAG